MATKRTTSPHAELRAINCMVRLLRGVALVCASLHAGVVMAESWPNKPVRTGEIARAANIQPN